MNLDYNEIVKDFDVEGLTLRKVTNKFVKENFADEISDLRLIMTMGNGNIDDNEASEPMKAEFGSEPEIKNQTAIMMTDLLMGQEMPTDVWLGFVRNMIKGDFVRTVQDQRGILLVSYDKTEVQTELETFASRITDIPEKEIIQGIKLALKDKIKNK